MIADLTASTAPTCEAALRLIADELGHRFDVQVNVRIEADSALSLDNRLELAQRDDLIRVAREAIVNAAVHGSTRHIDVALLRRAGTLVVRVSGERRLRMSSMNRTATRNLSAWSKKLYCQLSGVCSFVGEA